MSYIMSSSVENKKLEDLIHEWIVPVLHAILWAAALWFSQRVKDILPAANAETIEALQFISIFVVLFLEILIVLFDLYVSCRAIYLSPKFILFMIALLFVLIFTSVCSCISIMEIKEITTNRILPFIILSSAALKLIENLLVNNKGWYIVTDPQIRDARGIYTRRYIRLQP